MIFDLGYIFKTTFSSFCYNGIEFGIIKGIIKQAILKLYFFKNRQYGII